MADQNEVAYTGGGAWIWDIRNARLLRTLGSGMPITSVSFSPNGQWLATGSSDMTARIWHVQSGQQLSTFSHSRPLKAVAFSPNGQWLATGWRG